MSRAHLKTPSSEALRYGYLLTNPKRPTKGSRSSSNSSLAQNNLQNGTEVSVMQLDANTTEHSRGIRLGYLPQIRDVEDGVMEEIFAGNIGAKEGLEEMVRRGNDLLTRFEKSVN